jgi:hypothetical protein
MPLPQQPDAFALRLMGWASVQFHFLERQNKDANPPGSILPNPVRKGQLYEMISLTTRPWTSVKRKSRPE